MIGLLVPPQIIGRVGRLGALEVAPLAVRAPMEHIAVLGAVKVALGQAETAELLIDDLEYVGRAAVLRTIRRTPHTLGLVRALLVLAGRDLDDRAARALARLLRLARPHARRRRLRRLLRRAVLDPPQTIRVEHLRAQELGLDAQETTVKHVTPSASVEAIHTT